MVDWFGGLGEKMKEKKFEKTILVFHYFHSLFKKK